MKLSADGNESWLYESKQEDDAACGYFSSAAGDEGGWSFCFDAKGMVKRRSTNRSSYAIGSTWL